MGVTRGVERVLGVLDWAGAVLCLLAALLTGYIGLMIAFLSKEDPCVFWGAGHVLAMAAVLLLMTWAFSAASRFMKQRLPKRWWLQLAPLFIWYVGFSLTSTYLHQPYERCLKG